MFNAKYFDRFGNYKEVSFSNREEYLTFLKMCQDEELQLLEWDDTYLEDGK